MSQDTFPILGHFLGSRGCREYFSNIFCPLRQYFCQELFEIYSRCQLKNGAHLLNLMHRYTSPWMIKFRVSSQGGLQTSNDQIKIKVLPLTRLLWDLFFVWYFYIKESKGNKKNLYILMWAGLSQCGLLTHFNSKPFFDFDGIFYSFWSI